MGVVDSLSTGVSVLQRNPVIVALVFAYSLASTALVGLNLISPLLVLVGYLVLLFAVPFYTGGIIGMLEQGLGSTATGNRFLADGKSNYLSLFGGGIVLGIVTLVLYFVVAIVGAIVAVFVLGAGSMAGLTSASIAVLAVVGIIGLLIVLLPWFVLQFFPAAVVVDDLGLTDSFKRSGGLVKRNFLSVVGFDVLAFLISLIAQASTVYLYYVATDGFTNFATAGQTMFDALSTTQLGIYLAMTVVLGTAVGSVSQAYYVAYYDQLPR